MTGITANSSIGNELVDFEVYNSAGAKIWQAWDSPVSFVAGKPTRFTSSWTLPAQQAAGTYTLKLGVFTSNWAFQAWDDNAATLNVTGTSSNAIAGKGGTASLTSSSSAAKRGAQPRTVPHVTHKAQTLHKSQALHRRASHVKPTKRTHVRSRVSP